MDWDLYKYKDYIGIKINYYRNLNSLTIEELADITGLTETLISSYEAGTQDSVEDEIFYIAAALKVGIYDLLPIDKPNKDDNITKNDYIKLASELDEEGTRKVLKYINFLVGINENTPNDNLTEELSSNEGYEEKN